MTSFIKIIIIFIVIETYISASKSKAIETSMPKSHDSSGTPNSPPKDYSKDYLNKDHRIYHRRIYPNNIITCSENSCFKIIEFRVTEENEFLCTQKYIEIFYKYNDFNNIIIEKKGFLSNEHVISETQVTVDRCSRIKRFSNL